MTADRSKIVTLGEILVEIVAEEHGQGFRQPLKLVGPFPSGAPAIFIDQVARLGQPCGIIAAVGDDDFGRVNLERLERDGVDVSAVEVLSGYPTGSAFVRYRDDGSRDFVYNIRHSAAGRLSLTARAGALLEQCSQLHVSGASLFSRPAIAVALGAVEIVKAGGGSVSFDPNVRKEVMSDPEVLAALRTMLSRCDLFLPTGEELTLLTGSATEDVALEQILGDGKVVVLKRGAEGATYFGPGVDRIDCPA